LGGYINSGVEKAYDMVHELHILLFNTWLNTIVFGWRWWLEVLVSVLCWVAWMIFHDKKIQINYCRPALSQQYALLSWIP